MTNDDYLDAFTHAMKSLYERYSSGSLFFVEPNRTSGVINKMTEENIKLEIKLNSGYLGVKHVTTIETNDVSILIRELVNRYGLNKIIELVDVHIDEYNKDIDDDCEEEKELKGSDITEISDECKKIIDETIKNNPYKFPYFGANTDIAYKNEYSYTGNIFPKDVIKDITLTGKLYPNNMDDFIKSSIDEPTNEDTVENNEDIRLIVGDEYYRVGIVYDKDILSDIDRGYIYIITEDKIRYTVIITTAYVYNNVEIGDGIGLKLKSEPDIFRNYILGREFKKDVIEVVLGRKLPYGPFILNNKRYYLQLSSTTCGNDISGNPDCWLHNWSKEIFSDCMTEEQFLENAKNFDLKKNDNNDDESNQVKY